MNQSLVLQNPSSVPSNLPKRNLTSPINIASIKYYPNDSLLCSEAAISNAIKARERESHTNTRLSHFYMNNNKKKKIRHRKHEFLSINFLQLISVQLAKNLKNEK